jgi:hypothetical protein
MIGMVFSRFLGLQLQLQMTEKGKTVIDGLPVAAV